jgi:cholesterol oxidase
MTSTTIGSQGAPEHYDAVIIGSGFGGSVMAYRLAEAGLKVCVLERGKPYPPGSFARSPQEMKRNFWDPSTGLYGLFDVWSFRGIGAVISSGLGGGSLIYANVLIRKDEKWFVQEDINKGGYEYWPINRAELDPHYDRVEPMLNPQKYPLDHFPYSETPKTNALKEAAEALNLDWHLPNLAVTFANKDRPPVPGECIHEEERNLHDRDRYTCKLCGECDVGCNYGSKNTLDYNYLSAAQRQGAELKTLCEVRSFEPREGGGYQIQYVQHDLAREGKPFKTKTLPLTTITANQLILSAGTLGSTYLLLKNRNKFRHVSDKLGTRFGGNGDLITFALRATETRDGKKQPRVLEGSRGPVITSTIRMPDALDGGEGRGFYLQDAGYPGFVDWILEMFQAPSSFWKQRLYLTRLICSLVQGTGPAQSDLSGEISKLFGDTDLSSGMLPLLGMGRDIPNGVMRLRNGGDLDVDWTKTRSQPFFDRLRKTMEQVAGVLGAEFLDNPTWYLGRTIAAHPLGGCPMGRNESEGVVDAYGEVFNYPGFFIADGSVMPGPVGANPSLTIAALSDRFADRVLENHRKQRS